MNKVYIYRNYLETDMKKKDDFFVFTDEAKALRQMLEDILEKINVLKEDDIEFTVQNILSENSVLISFNKEIEIFKIIENEIKGETTNVL